MRNYHINEQVIGDVHDKVKTRSSFIKQAHTTIILEIKPKIVDDSLKDEE